MDAEVQRTAARFVREKLPVSLVREGDLARARWRELAELGLVGLALPEPFGGLGFRALGTVLVECGRTLAPLPWSTASIRSMCTSTA